MEETILEQKLKSKEEALIILKRELLNCQKERNYYKNALNCFHTTNKITINKHSSDITMDLALENNKLMTELEDLRKKNNDLSSDLKVLRKKTYNENEYHLNQYKTSDFNISDKYDLISQLEELQLKYKHLESDFNVLLDEKEELLQERDLYRQKVDRLNYELKIALNGDNNKICDIDSLIMENRNLQTKLNQIQREKDCLEQLLSKCMDLLETVKNKRLFKPGSNSTSAVNVTYKHIRHLLNSKNSSLWSSNLKTAISKLEYLTIALLDMLQDKTIALLHQKKTNKALAKRIIELECMMESDGFDKKCENSSPSQILLEGYSETYFEMESDNKIDEDCHNGNRTSYATMHERYADICTNLPVDLQILFQDIMKSVLNEMPGYIDSS